MSSEIINIILTVVNILVAACLVFFTYKYTAATKRIARLDEERKIWEVQPIIVFLDKVGGDIDYYNKHFKTSIPEKDSYRVIGIKNIGRGVAKITLANCFPTRSDNYWLKNSREFSLPFYLGVEEEFIFSWLPKDSATDFREIDLKVNYTDVHSNAYYLSSFKGAIKEGKGQCETR